MTKWILTVMLMVFSGSSVARAQKIVCPDPAKDLEKNKEEARRFFNMANTYFNLEEYDRAVVSFDCVVKLVPYSVNARFQLARALDRLGRYSLAKVQYRWLLADASEESSPLKPDVEKRLAEIESLPDAVGDQTKAPSAGLTSKWWFWTGAGAVVVFSGLALFTGLRTLDERDKWESTWNTANKDRMENYRTLTDVSLAAAVLSTAGLGVAIWMNRSPGSGATPTESRVTWLPSCGPDGCMMSLSWKF